MMLLKELTVVDEMGLHARPASQLVAMANKFSCAIDIESNGKKLTLKSIMAVMSMGIKCNESFTLHFDGEDETIAFDELSGFLVSEGICK